MYMPEEHKELVGAAQKVGATGFDWASIASRYGPVLVQALIHLLENYQQGDGMQATAESVESHHPNYVRDGLDCSIRGLATELATLISLRNRCESR